MPIEFSPQELTTLTNPKNVQYAHGRAIGFRKALTNAKQRSDVDSLQVYSRKFNDRVDDEVLSGAHEAAENAPSRPVFPFTKSAKLQMLIGKLDAVQRRLAGSTGIDLAAAVAITDRFEKGKQTPHDVAEFYHYGQALRSNGRQNCAVVSERDPFQRGYHFATPDVDAEESQEFQTMSDLRESILRTGGMHDALEDLADAHYTANRLYAFLGTLPSDKRAAAEAEFRTAIRQHENPAMRDALLAGLARPRHPATQSRPPESTAEHPARDMQRHLDLLTSFGMDSQRDFDLLTSFATDSQRAQAVIEHFTTMYTELSGPARENALRMLHQAVARNPNPEIRAQMRNELQYNGLTREEAALPSLTPYAPVSSAESILARPVPRSRSDAQAETTEFGRLLRNRDLTFVAPLIEAYELRAQVMSQLGHHDYDETLERMYRAMGRESTG